MKSKKPLIEFLNVEAKWTVALDIGLLNKGMIDNWIKNYKNMGYNIVERKRGKVIKRLKQENLYLKAELEYSKN